MTELIEANQPTSRHFPAHSVEIADKLTGPWVHIPDLFCSIARFVAGPELDLAVLRWNYGFKVPIGGTAAGYYYPAEMTGLYLRVVVEGLDEKDYWYGVVEEDSRNAEGARQPGLPSGQQTMVAYGLGRLLERTFIYGIRAETQTIGRGRPFNGDSPFFGERGNRSNAKVSETYVFSDEQRGQSVWTVQDAMEYLLKYHVPVLTGITWFLNVPDDDLLARPMPRVETDTRSTKEVIDEILDRRRGIGYAIQFNPDELRVELTCFSFADQPVTNDAGSVLISANLSATDLNFEHALDVEARVLYYWGTEADEVQVLGERATSTLTLELTDGELEPDWTSEEETSFLDGVSGQAGYDDWDPQEKYRRNEAWRRWDRLRNVFARWRIAADWDQLAKLLSDPAEEYFAFPVSDTKQKYVMGSVEAGLALWNQGIRILPQLPLKYRLDYSGTRIEDATWQDATKLDAGYLPPLIHVYDAADSALPWQLVDRLMTSQDDQPRGWSVNVLIDQDDPAIELRVTDGRQQLLAKTVFAGADGDVDPDHDPATQRGLDWTNIDATICLQADHRVSATKTIRNPPDRPKRVIRIFVPDARLDYVVPRTVVDIQNGNRVYTDTGGYVRDDREKLATIAELAANWYGRQRTALSLRFKNVDRTFSVGLLIRSIGNVYDVPDLPDDASEELKLNVNRALQERALSTRPVNSPVTVVEWNFERATQSIETAYPELDFA